MCSLKSLPWFELSWAVSLTGSLGVSKNVFGKGPDCVLDLFRNVSCGSFLVRAQEKDTSGKTPPKSGSQRSKKDKSGRTNPWWEFRPPKKILTPPPPEFLADTSPPLGPSLPLLGDPPPLLCFQ